MGKLADEMIAFGLEGVEGLLDDVILFIRESFGLGAKIGEGVYGGGAEADFKFGERDDNIEFFIQNVALFDQLFDELAVLDDAALNDRT